MTAKIQTFVLLLLSVAVVSGCSTAKGAKTDAQDSWAYLQKKDSEFQEKNW